VIRDNENETFAAAELLSGAQRTFELAILLKPAHGNHMIVRA
jgi:hypothetical protein